MWCTKKKKKKKIAKKATTTTKIPIASALRAVRLCSQCSRLCEKKKNFFLLLRCCYQSLKPLQRLVVLFSMRPSIHSFSIPENPFFSHLSIHCAYTRSTVIEYTLHCTALHCAKSPKGFLILSFLSDYCGSSRVSWKNKNRLTQRRECHLVVLAYRQTQTRTTWPSSSQVKSTSISTSISRIIINKELARVSYNNYFPVRSTLSLRMQLFIQFHSSLRSSSFRWLFHFIAVTKIKWW